MKKSTLLIKNVLHDGKETNILIEGNVFASTNAPADAQADTVIDGKGLAILPPFYNTHTHAAMTLLRGFADDLPLKTWLEDYIWPREATLTSEDIYNGSRLAIAEMIKSGTVFFSDMYFDIDQTINAVQEFGVRAAIGVTVMDNHPAAVLEEKINTILKWTDPTGGRIQLTLAPHAIYTVGSERLKKSAALAKEAGLKLHIHASETAGEVQDSIREHGLSPIAYLDSLGVLDENTIIAHGVHVDDNDIRILEDKGVTVSHNPCSNMKLGSGLFPYEKYLNSSVRVTMGTDGASSNNNLDLREEAKFACLAAKCQGRPELLPVETAFQWATKNGAEAYGINAGEIKEGKLADAVLIDLTNERMRPLHNLISNWIYSADSSCVNTVICDGRIILKDHKLTNN